MSDSSSYSPEVRLERPSAGSQSNTSLAGRLARLSMIGVGLFVVLVVVLHFLRGMNNAMSYYADGAYGYLMTTAFLAYGLGALALTVGLWQSSLAGHRSRFGMILLGVSGLCTALLAFFPIDAPGAPQTAHGSIHLILGNTFIFFILAALLLSRQFVNDPRWQGFSRTAMVVALLVLAAGLVLVVLGTLQPDLNGVLQRVYTVPEALWLVVAGAGLASVSVPSSQSSVK